MRYPQRLYARRSAVSKQIDDKVRTAWRHAEHGRNDRALTRVLVRVTALNGPKVQREPGLSAMTGAASGCMLETLKDPVVLNMSDKPSGADNQQERLSANWVVGFVDGEGCFFVGINRQPSMKIGWQVLPEFRVVQHQRDVAVLTQLRQFFGFGQITRNHGDRKELRIRGLRQLSQVVAFFRKHPLRMVKRSSFDCFAEVIDMMMRDDHLTEEGLEKIRNLASRMNRGAQNPQRPYARTPVL
jgi:hypothetical protein